MTEDKAVTTTKYPNAFLFGCTSGVVLQLATRAATYEPLAARPFSYLRTGLFMGVMIGYFDFFRRKVMQEVM